MAARARASLVVTRHRGWVCRGWGRPHVARVAAKDPGYLRRFTRQTAMEESDERLVLRQLGAADATRASIPLHLAANGSVEVGQEPSIILAGDATELLVGDNVGGMEGVGLPPVRELLAKLRDHEIPVYV